jgi:hypothetical protein
VIKGNNVSKFFGLSNRLTLPFSLKSSFASHTRLATLLVGWFASSQVMSRLFDLGFCFGRASTRSRQYDSPSLSELSARSGALPLLSPSEDSRSSPLSPSSPAAVDPSSDPTLPFVPFDTLEPLPDELDDERAPEEAPLDSLAAAATDN